MTVDGASRYTEPASAPLTMVSVPRSQTGAGPNPPGHVGSARASAISSRKKRDTSMGWVALRAAWRATFGARAKEITGALLPCLPSLIDVGAALPAELRAEVAEPRPPSI